MCVESFVRSRGVYLHIHTLSYQGQDSHQELDGYFSCCIKNIQEDQDSQVGELVVVMEQRKEVVRELGAIKELW